MMIIYQIRTLFCCILLCICSNIFAQHIIIEERNGETINNTEFKIASNKNNYNKVKDENDQKIYLSNQSLNQNASVNDVSPEANVTLSLQLQYDPSLLNPRNFLVFDENGSFHSQLWQGVNPVIFNVPAGENYEIMAAFINPSTGQTHMVIEESFPVTGNTVFEVDVSEANNYVSIDIYDETGNLISPGIINPQTNKISEVNLTSYIYFEAQNFSLSVHVYSWNNPFPGEPIWNFFTNDISNRYSFIHDASVVNYKNDYYFTKFEVLSNLSENAALSNDPDAWVHHIEKFEASILGANDGFSKGFSTTSIVNGNISGGIGTFEEDTIAISDGIPMWLNNPIEESSSNFLVSPFFRDHMAPLYSNGPEMKFYIIGNSVYSDDDGEVQYASGSYSFGTTHFDGWNYYKVGNEYKALPLNSKFNYSGNQSPEIKQGNNVPILIFSLVNSKINFYYKGNFGEIREVDLLATAITIKRNGNPIFTGSYMEFLNFNIPTSGQIEISVSNTNINAFGLTGTNEAKITFDNDGDSTPPTLQVLQFRDSNENVTNHFASASDGRVRIAAGDFGYDSTGHFLEYKPGNTIEMFYSLHNEDHWTELTLIEDPAYFQMPAFGDYYEASLESIINIEEDSWYDAKIICTDANGNKQEQILSPAFKIQDAFLNIEEITANSDLNIYPNPFSEELNIILPDSFNGDYTFKVTDVTGKMIHSSIQKEKSFVWNTSLLAKGLYILSIENDGEVIVKKAIRK